MTLLPQLGRRAFAKSQKSNQRKLWPSISYPLGCHFLLEIYTRSGKCQDIQFASHPAKIVSAMHAVVLLTLRSTMQSKRVW